MDAQSQKWQVFDALTPILTYEYSFGPGFATSLAVGGRDGLIVVSAPCRVASSAFDELARYGPLRALVASNAFHHLGLPAWKARFPDAAVFAPAQSIPRVEAKAKLKGIRPLAEAGSITGEHLELVDMPHYKTGEVLVRAKSERGLVWYLTDVIMNLPALPPHPVVKMMFKLSKSAPGLRFNNIAPMFMVKDKPALKRWLAAELEKSPPRWIIPTHGDIVDLGSGLEPARRLFSPG
jgi:hypothetical protein